MAAKLKEGADGPRRPKVERMGYLCGKPLEVFKQTQDDCCAGSAGRIQASDSGGSGPFRFFLALRPCASRQWTSTWLQRVGWFQDLGLSLACVQVHGTTRPQLRDFPAGLQRCLKLL